MNRNLISIILILSLMECAVALDAWNGVEMRPGEAAAERLFEKGFGQPWVGGNPPSSNWGREYDPFDYYSHQGKTYHRHIYSNYLYPVDSWYPSYYHYYDYYPFTYRDYWYPYTYQMGYWWS
jgi:hypothetical protein